ncbi:DUF7288 family protein [Natronomonas amylolytica]|uniref:DUF7288 family protein n=1 Tax=Natronomonas amylolytica TaxID=3108498 RepID=UPI00300B5A84
MGEENRGQAYTLEAVIAALLIISSLVFALQVTAVTPLSASTSNQHIENQQRASADGVLAAAQESGALKDAILYWNDSESRFHNTSTFDYYTNVYPQTEFGNITDRAFGGRGLAVNVELYTEGQNSAQRLIYRGEPSDNAVTASRQVTLYDDDTLTAPGHEGTNVSAADSYSKAVPERDGSNVYNVVRVEVTVWRM